MIYKAQKHKGMVLSTDNYTEYLLGFWTLHGDVGDFGMTQNLWKTEVYGLSNYLMEKYERLGLYDKARALEVSIDAMPTDGLGITDSDFDQLCPDNTKMGSPQEIYNYIDISLLDKKDNSITRRRKRTTFKRHVPYNIPRKDIIRVNMR